MPESVPPLSTAVTTGCAHVGGRVPHGRRGYPQGLWTTGCRRGPQTRNVALRTVAPGWLRVTVGMCWECVHDVRRRAAGEGGSPMSIASSSSGFAPDTEPPYALDEPWSGPGGGFGGGAGFDGGGRSGGGGGGD